jgi:uncharacterized protein DUF4430
MSDTLSRRLRKIRAELIALGLLVPLTAVLALTLRWFPQTTDTAPTPVAETQTPTPSATPAPSPTPRAPDTATPTPETASVVLDVRAPSGPTTYHVPVPAGPATVAEILASAADHSGLQLKTKDFGGSLGTFVEAINGVENDPARSLYWSLYVNGTFSPLGASSARVRAGDTVTWKYEHAHED